MAIHATPEPRPDPLAQLTLGPCIRSEEWRVDTDGYERYLRKKRNKAKREAWRQ
jgi:hypothetical protein